MKYCLIITVLLLGTTGLGNALYGQTNPETLPLRIAPVSQPGACDGAIEFELEAGHRYALFSLPEGALEDAHYPYDELCPGQYLLRDCDAADRCHWRQEFVIGTAPAPLTRRLSLQQAD